MLQQRFEAVLFDWDGTAIAARTDDATELRSLLESLSAHACDLAIVTGTSLEHVDAQLQARPRGPGSILVACNRGSELYRLSEHGPGLVERHVATPQEDAALDRAAHETQTALAARGLHTAVVSSRVNRRKIDLIPEPEWRDPPKAAIAELVVAVQARIAATEVQTLPAAVAIADACARRAGLLDPRITSDAKHIEIGLTDKGDAVTAIAAAWSELGITSGLVLVVGDEFGSLGGVPGSDAHLLAIGDHALAVSVGVEPEGVPAGVDRLGGGPAAFRRLLREQLRLRADGALPRIDPAPEWTIDFPVAVDTPAPVAGACCTLADGVVGMRGVPLHGPRSDIPAVLVTNAYCGTGPDTELLAAPEPAGTQRDATGQRHATSSSTCNPERCMSRVPPTNRWECDSSSPVIRGSSRYATSEQRQAPCLLRPRASPPAPQRNPTPGMSGWLPRTPMAARCRRSGSEAPHSPEPPRPTASFHTTNTTQAALPSVRRTTPGSTHSCAPAAPQAVRGGGAPMFAAAMPSFNATFALDSCT
jgi:hydroxymethylpyrimidine pyrophosphatase-like HAD family hydrolase